ncbi:ParB/RepB/Spo0J family partition protein [Candidatus Saccharibacteria bacterium oral taxon 955]|nr:ParB/RepB/Spo0J family partition protein [Candidatus Saccharibacteria bacterium oral taxon 955]
MSAKRGGLGRGLESLIPTEVLDESFDPTAEQDEQISDLRHIKLSEIVADPNQPRRTFDEASLEELSASIKEHGILQPIVVVPHEGKYMIVAGERRFRAAMRAGMEKIPALVRTLSNQHRLELSLIENLQRRDLNPLETATAYLKLRDQFNLTLDQIGQRVGGKSVAAISNTLRLLRLPASVRAALADGRLREGQVRPLINLDSDLIEAVLPRIIAEEWSARAVEQYVSSVKKMQSAKRLGEKPPVEHPYANSIARIEKRFSVPVRITTTARGSGQVVLSFKNDDEFQRIAKLLEK